MAWAYIDNRHMSWVVGFDILMKVARTTHALVQTRRNASSCNLWKIIEVFSPMDESRCVFIMETRQIDITEDFEARYIWLLILSDKKTLGNY